MNMISVVGLGKLGQCIAVCFAVKGYEVIGIDIDENTVNSINNGVSSIVEPRLQEFILKAGDKLKATLNHEEAIDKTDITFIMVSTPSNPDGSFSNRNVESVLKSLAEALGKSDKKYHLFVISCTVMPGSIEESFIPLIEQISGRILNDGFGICYNPYFIALGSVIKNFLNPDFIVIGESDKFAGDQVAAIHQRICENNPSIFQMSLVNAEIAKISLNCYITTKISFANTLANLCERIPGADVDTITQAIGTDKRITPYYLRGGLSYGGTCFPRDTAAFKALAKKYGHQEELISAVEKINKYQDEHLAALVLSNIAATGNKKASILGLSFKPDTPVIVESPAIKLIQKLLERDVEVTVYDPLAMENTKAVFGNSIQYANSAKDCISRSPLCIITTQWTEFKVIDDSYIENKPYIVIDCWRILDPSRFTKHVTYIAYGKQTPM